MTVEVFSLLQVQPAFWNVILHFVWREHQILVWCRKVNYFLAPIPYYESTGIIQFCRRLYLARFIVYISRRLLPLCRGFFILFSGFCMCVEALAFVLWCLPLSCVFLHLGFLYLCFSNLQSVSAMQFVRRVPSTVEENSGCGLNSAALMCPRCGQMLATQYEVLSECDPDTSGSGLAQRDHSVGKNRIESV